MNTTERKHLPKILVRAAELAHGTRAGFTSVSTYDTAGVVYAICRSPFRSVRVWIEDLTAYAETRTPEGQYGHDAETTRIIADALHLRAADSR